MTRITLSKERDFPILLSLWKYKVLTTSAIHQKYFPKCDPFTAYKRLRTLKRAGFVSTYSFDDSKKHVWALDQRGFFAIRKYLPGLKQEGFRSEHVEHDWIVAGFQLGDLWLINEPRVEIFTEQQLRCTEDEFFPAWMPNSKLHRPDGYWHLPLAKPMTIALEVELHLKRPFEYESVHEFYSDKSDINYVIWVTGQRSSAKYISKKFSEFGNKSDKSKHLFVTLGENRINGWQSEFIYSQISVRNIREFFCKYLENSWKSLSNHLLFDFRKCPFKPFIYEEEPMT